MHRGGVMNEQSRSFAVLCRRLSSHSLPFGDVHAARDLLMDRCVFSRSCIIRRSHLATPPPPTLVTTPYHPQAKRNNLILSGEFGLLIALGTLLLRLPFAGATRPLTWSEAYRADHAA